MPPRSLDAVFYVSQPPAIEERDGMFHITYDTGTMRFEFALPPRTYLMAFEKAARVTHQWCGAECGEIVPFRKLG